MAHTPTDEQTAIIQEVSQTSSNLMVKAFAGCAKTSTIEMAAARLPPGTAAMALAFNTRIKKELEARLPKSFTVLTLNGLGHRAWTRAIDKRPELVDYKLSKCVQQVLSDAQSASTQDQRAEIRDLVTKAMHAGLVPSTFPHKSLIPDTPDTWRALADDAFLDVSDFGLEVARSALILSIKQGFAGLISFDDQIYLSACFGGQFPRVPLILGDEAQDWSPLNHIQVRRTAAGRIIAVGDPLQAIYGFRGADHTSMTSMEALRPEWSHRTLSMTFRCPQVVVQRQRWHASGFRAAPGNAQGLFLPHPKGQAVGQAGGWSWADVEGLREGLPDGPKGPLAVLCRNNAPLLKLAFALIRQGIGPTMLGRDIGVGLIALSRKILPEDSTPRDLAIGFCQSWLESETAKAAAEGKEAKLAGIIDRGECLLAVLPSVRDAGELRTAIGGLFDPKNSRVVLSSIHKAKGLEWPLVLHLDPWRIPSRYALKAADQGDPRQLQQERNLLYVLETRSQNILLNANLAELESLP